jgi:hypothetical protein
VLLGCDKAAPPPEPEPVPPRAPPPAAIASEVQRELEELAAEAGVESVTDPPTPSGDLKSEVESFTTLDACVRTRTLSDPLLGDAIDALGYDTLTRDACRILQALQEKKGDACKAIASSALRARCETYVAVATGDPNACPLNGSGRSAARDPVCLARANRDERLCAAALTTERTRCRALVLGQKAECGRDDACVRQVERFKSLLERPGKHAPLPAHLRVELAEEGRGETKSLDLDDVAAAGAVVRVGSGGTRVSLGLPKTVLWPAPDAPQATAKLFVEFAAPAPAAGKKGPERAKPVPLGTGDLRLDLLVPKVALLSALLANDTKLELDELSVQPEGPIKFKIESMLHEAPRNFRVKLDVETFVRERTGPSE